MLLHFAYSDHARADGVHRAGWHEKRVARAHGERPQKLVGCAAVDGAIEALWRDAGRESQAHLGPFPRHDGVPHFGFARLTGGFVLARVFVARMHLQR